RISTERTVAASAAPQVIRRSAAAAIRGRAGGMPGAYRAQVKKRLTGGSQATVLVNRAGTVGSSQEQRKPRGFTGKATAAPPILQKQWQRGLYSARKVLDRRDAAEPLGQPPQQREAVVAQRRVVDVDHHLVEERVDPRPQPRQVRERVDVVALGQGVAGLGVDR